MLRRGTVVGLLLLGGALASWLMPGRDARARPAAPAVQLSRVPRGGLVPSVAVAADGTVHLAFGREHKPYYSRSSDGGRTWSEPLLISSSATLDTAAERGPRVALGRGGTPQVAWMGGRGQGVFYTRAGSGGRFAIERNLLERGDADGLDIVTDGRGRVYLVWLDPRLGPDPNSPVSKAIFMTASSDDGQTFGPNTEVRSDYPGRACACCALHAGMDPAGRFVIAFRGGYQNVRDIYLVREGRAARVSDDGWKFEGCPMSGPFLQAGQAPALVAWMSQGEVYYAREGGPRTPPRAARSVARNYPLALVNKRGEVLFAWVEGPKLRWEAYAPDSALLSSGDTDSTPKSRPTGFVVPDGSFTVVY